MKKIDNNTVEGEGFKVKCILPFQLYYYEGDKVIRFGVENASSGISIYFTKPKWGLDYSVDWLNDEEKSRVKERVSKALDLLKIKYHFDTNESPY
ncbi:MAG: hypothetical protein CMO01_17425 [Thalassobius sp.]|nr:hypothetical protein [Thalassovita sp.]